MLGKRKNLELNSSGKRKIKNGNRNLSKLILHENEICSFSANTSMSRHSCLRVHCRVEAQQTRDLSLHGFPQGTQLSDKKTEKRENKEISNMFMSKSAVFPFFMSRAKFAILAPQNCV